LITIVSFSKLKKRKEKRRENKEGKRRGKRGEEKKRVANLQRAIKVEESC
jgi:hypothetical protein